MKFNLLLLLLTILTAVALSQESITTIQSLSNGLFWSYNEYNKNVVLGPEQQFRWIISRHSDVYLISPLIFTPIIPPPEENYVEYNGPDIQLTMNYTDPSDPPPNFLWNIIHNPTPEHPDTYFIDTAVRGGYGFLESATAVDELPERGIVVAKHRELNPTVPINPKQLWIMPGFHS